MYVEDEVKTEVTQFVEQLFAMDDAHRLPSVRWCKEMAAQALHDLGLDDLGASQVCVAEAKRTLRLEEPSDDLKEATSAYWQQRVVSLREKRISSLQPYDIKPFKAEALKWIEACFTEHMIELGGEVPRSEVQGARFTTMGVRHLRHNLHLQVLIYGKIDNPLKPYVSAQIVSSETPITDISLEKIVGIGAWKLSLDTLSKEALCDLLVEPFAMLEVLVAQFDP